MNKKEIKALILTLITSISISGYATYNMKNRNDKNINILNNIKEYVLNISSILENNKLDINNNQEIISSPNIEEPSYNEEEVIVISSPEVNNQLVDENNSNEMNLDESYNEEVITSPIPIETVILNEFGYINQDTYVYDDNFNVKGIIPAYQKVLKVMENEYCYYVLFEDNTYGYIDKSSYSILDDTYIEIDIDSQKLYFYLENELILSSNIVSGKNETPTYNGYFYIFYKETDAILRSERYGYETPVSYWMAFDGNIGMHDANWRDNFGGYIYQLDGSHGCVNLPFEVAKFIYENTWTNNKDGTKVLVHN